MKTLLLTFVLALSVGYVNAADVAPVSDSSAVSLDKKAPKHPRVEGNLDAVKKDRPAVASVSERAGGPVDAAKKAEALARRQQYADAHKKCQEMRKNGTLAKGEKCPLLAPKPAQAPVAQDSAAQAPAATTAA